MPKYEYEMTDENRLDGWYTDFIPGFKHYPSNHMNTKGRNPAREMFEWLGGDSGKRDNPIPPRWEAQPESLQDVFIRKAQPNTQHYHFGLNQIFCVRGDLTTFHYTPATGRHSHGHPSLRHYPTGPSEGVRDLRRIEALEAQLETISQRFEGKEERREERRRIKLEIYKFWRRISPKEVSKAILIELYESHIDKSDDVKLPQWMQEKADEEKRRVELAAERDAWKATLTPEQLALYDKGRDSSNFKNAEEWHAWNNNPDVPRFESKIKADSPAT